MEILAGKIIDVTPEGLTIRVPNVDFARVCLRQYDEVQVGLPDGRTITPVQRRKAYALIGEISEWMGEGLQTTKQLLKLEFITRRLQALVREIFSLSDCDVTTAREFITFLIDFMLENDVPSRVPLTELCEDIERYVYACLMNKRCAVCGQKAELHHAEDRIGMGGDRKTMVHEGMRVMPLCRTHHMQCHETTQAAFNEGYHLVSIVATKEICKVYGLKYICE